MTTPEICPNCGAEVPPNAKACPECGSCEETGWSKTAHTGGLGLPDDDFDYDEYVKKEFGERNYKPHGGHFWFWWVIGLLLITIILIMIFWWK